MRKDISKELKEFVAVYEEGIMKPFSVSFWGSKSIFWEIKFVLTFNGR